MSFSSYTLKTEILKEKSQFYSSFPPECQESKVPAAYQASSSFQEEGGVKLLLMGTACSGPDVICDAG